MISDNIIFNKLKQQLNKYNLLSRFYRSIYLCKLWLSDVSSAFLSKSTKLKLTPYGFKLIGSNSIHHVAMQEGLFEQEESQIINNYLLSSDIFVDVGANIGFYTCLARTAGKHVVAIEPLPKNIKYLSLNILENNWPDIEVFPLGLSEQPGLATLYGGSSTGASLISRWAGASQLFRQTISVSTLDILLGDRFAGKKMLIKIDVEGVEYKVLLGARNILSMQPKPTWIVEICFDEYYHDGINKDFQNIFNLFWEYGYEARTANQSNILIKPSDIDHWISQRQCISKTINYLFY